MLVFSTAGGACSNPLGVSIHRLLRDESPPPWRDGGLAYWWSEFESRNHFEYCSNWSTGSTVGCRAPSAEPLAALDAGAAPGTRSLPRPIRRGGLPNHLVGRGTRGGQRCRGEAEIDQRLRWQGFGVHAVPPCGGVSRALGRRDVPTSHTGRFRTAYQFAMLRLLMPCQIPADHLGMPIQFQVRAVAPFGRPKTLPSAFRLASASRVGPAMSSRSISPPAPARWPQYGYAATRQKSSAAWQDGCANSRVIPVSSISNTCSVERAIGDFRKDDDIPAASSPSAMPMARSRHDRRPERVSDKLAGAKPWVWHIRECHGVDVDILRSVETRR